MKKTKELLHLQQLFLHMVINQPLYISPIQPSSLPML